MSNENAAIQSRWFEEVWNKGREEAIEEMFAEDGIAYGLGESEVDVRGPAEYRPFFQRLRGAFPDIKVTIEDAISEGDKVGARWVAEMTHTGDHLGIPATGKRVKIRGVLISRFRDGKIIESWNSWDTLGLLQQIGAISSTTKILEKQQQA